MSHGYAHIKYLFSGILILGSGVLFSQTGNIGINTPTPKNTLHVNGSLQVTKELNLGGTASTAGSAGLSNQVLVSQGAGNPATWKDVNSLITPSNVYALTSFKEFTTNSFTLPASTGSNGQSYGLGFSPAITITKPNNTFVVYIDIDTFSYQLYNQSAIAYGFLANVTSGSTELALQDTGALVINGSVFADTRTGNFRSFVFRNLPVGNVSVGIFAKRHNYEGPNGTKDLTFLPGSVHVYLYER